MGRIALRGLVAAGCFICALLMANAAEKMKPPLPKPKPAQITAPAPDAVQPEIDTTESNPFLPREKPEQAQKPAQITAPAPDAAQPETDTTDSNPLPREKPEQAQKPAPVPIPKPEAKPGNDQAQDEDKPEPGENLALCRSELTGLGAKFTVPEMPAADGKCNVPNPVQITAIATPIGEVDFPGNPILNCIFAKRFTSWVSDVAAPVVQAHTGEGLAAIVTGPGYECRSRNGDTTTKISEHASGNAVDIAAFKLADKESLPVANVAKTGHVEARWLMALRISACGYFTTVLGPGSNAAHAEHYHFDLGLHGKSGNYRICE